MIQIKLTAPKPSAFLKTHKGDKPNRLVINNIQAPSYKLSRHLNKRFDQLINLPHKYGTINLKEIAQELNIIQINNQHKMTTLDIKDLCVKLPLQNIINITNSG